MNSRFTPILLLLIGVGCSGDREALVMRAQVDTVGARIKVANTGRPIWTETNIWRLEEDLRLGTALDSGAEVEQFGDIEFIASDARGRIYVLDWLSQEIRVFQPTGSYSHTIGRRGRGPGELWGAWTLSIGSGDTLTVLDDGVMRFSVFGPEGEHIKSHRRHIVGFGSPRQALLDDGSYLDWAPAFPDGRFGPRVFFYPVRYGPGFDRADTFPPIELIQDMVPDGQMPLMAYGGFVVASADTRGNVWFANSREYRIFRLSLEGDTTLVFTLPAEAAPLGETERESVRKSWTRRPDIGAQQLAGLPRTKPIIYGIMPDNVGHLYVFADVAGEAPGTVVDVFRETGEYLGRMSLPAPVALMPGRPPVAHITAEYLYVVVMDDMDVPYVSRLKIVKES